MTTIIRPVLLLIAATLTSIACPIARAGQIVADDYHLVRVTPAYYEQALRNPMKGFTADTGHEWATLSHVYIRWNELENHESDGPDRILDVTNRKFAGGPENNVKFIPRVYLHWSADHQKFWPEDMDEDDYTSEQFRTRVTRLIERLGVAWNDAPGSPSSSWEFSANGASTIPPTPPPKCRRLSAKPS